VSDFNADEHNARLRLSSDDQGKPDWSLTPEEQARYDNPHPSFAEVKGHLDVLPPLTAGRASWLNRKGISHDDGENRIYELPPSHPLTQIDETALAFIIRDKEGQPVDVAWFLPRSPDQPRRASFCGKATFINEAAITAREYTKSRPLHIWWSAYNWLRAGRIGIVILDPFEARALAAVPWLAAESFRHAQASFDWDWADGGAKVLVPKRTDI
jgi:hypothetical protein